MSPFSRHNQVVPPFGSPLSRDLFLMGAEAMQGALAEANAEIDHRLTAEDVDAIAERYSEGRQFKRGPRINPHD